MSNTDTTTAIDIIWQDPPELGASTGRPRNEAFRAALRANPGRWAVYRAGSRSQGGRAGNLKKEGFEVTTRTVVGDDGTKTYTTYVRWPEQ